MEERKVVSGYISNYIYESQDSLYKVCELVQEDDTTLIIVGSFPHLEDGLSYEFVGKMKKHPKYGEQFFVESYSKSNSFSKEGLIHYLSSDKFYGIGPKLASNIVDELGLDCIDKILEDKEVLKKVYGMTKPKIEVLYQTLKDNYATEQVFIRLFGFGLTAKMVERLYNTYSVSAANKVEENPYCLITEVEGFGFKKCDSLALNLGMKRDDPKRLSAAIFYTLNQVCYQQGFTFLTEEQLINSVIRLLDNEINSNDLKPILDDLVQNKKIILEDNKYFDAYLHKCEVKTAEAILRLAGGKLKKYPEEKVRDAIKYVEELLHIQYTPMQKEAIFTSILNKLSIITGGPGTGKSTILNGILNVYAKLNDLPVASDEFGYKVCMVAPTGRAAKRMAEATKYKASTIHKALGYNFDGDFSYNEDSKMAYSLLIVDEASMMDISITMSLFTALQDKCQIILVGDKDQLPSVGPGNVLYDLMQSDVFITTKLNQIMRQAKDSDIISLSHMVLSERIDYKIFNNKKEVFFYNSDVSSTIPMLKKLLDGYLANGGDLQSGIQILAPMYAGNAGIDAINSFIQEEYNKEKEKILKRDFKIFKKNDKVLQLKNDSVHEIMNGDIGKILDVIKVDEKDAMLIDFDGRIITYMASDIENLTLAYCMSIHKSQGSEFENVIMPILPSYQIMLKKKIIYTGMTRAKKKLILLGKTQSLEQAIHAEDYLRQTYLTPRLSKKISNELDNKIFDKDIPFDTFGEYDMEGITPYSFMEK
ncbi:MAG: ATP-dependent RecD-like DNA helicase [Acholeplasmatales bacterium]|nr:ATP-dependent RecD-like DNA helicase [Acholeplasmatales bacterium]